MFYNQQDAAGNGNPGKEIQQCKTPVSSAELKSEQSTASIDHIIAAENLAETLKVRKYSQWIVIHYITSSSL